MTGYVGEVGLVPPTNNPPLLNQRVGKLVLERDGTEALAFVYCLTRQADFKSAIEVMAHGTAQANVSSEGILSVQTVIPPDSLRNRFNTEFRPALDRILSYHAESEMLAAARDALLPPLLSGELRVPQAERLVERLV